MGSGSSRGEAGSGTRESSNSRVLLIIDDSAIVRETISSLLGFCFDEVLAVAYPDEAERILETKRITHLLCDNDFGETFPTGMDLIPEWRRRFPEIECAVLFTGDPFSNVDDLEGVDKIVVKPAQCDTLVSSLAVEPLDD